MAPPVDVHGTVDPRFDAVRTAFARNFERHGDVGAACCVWVGGRPVVDVCGGVADTTDGRPWEHDTPCVVFSTTKGVTAIAVNLLVQRGVLDLDASVATYWPEFAANGKGGIPLRWLLSHRAGLAHVTADLTLDDVLAWDPVVDAIAAQEPVWEPGTAHGYHVRSYGWLLGEVVRRVTGMSIGAFVARELAAPLHLDLWIGLPETVEARIARLLPPLELQDEHARELFEAFMKDDPLRAGAMGGPSNLFRYDDMWNTRALHAAEMPSSNGVATAPALAKLYAACIGDVGGVRILDGDTVARASRVESDGEDVILGIPTRFGLGFSLPPMLSPAAGPGAFGHPGAGGSLAFADPDNELAFAYVMNQMQLGLTGDRRTETLVAAVYDALA
ncbi:MAG TPA: serine hydrolase domain-containing protein [Acidimicrobiia bacterium]|nr:serine hydrolase domain-containing protein [Acidimicrobiia bacterium]